MRIHPVLDLMGGRVVRGVAGRREEYGPLTSCICPNSDPLEAARNFRDRFGLDRPYLADLDAIGGRTPSLELFRRLADEGFRCLVDAGIRRAKDAEPVLAAGVDRLVVGLETLDHPSSLVTMVSEFGPERLVFSLDLHGGRPLGGPAWPDAIEPTLDLLADAGFAALLVLDLACVGVGGGVGTEGLLREIHARSPEFQLLAGGGVRGAKDLHRLDTVGVDGVLVASTLHDGTLSPSDCSPYS